MKGEGCLAIWLLLLSSGLSRASVPPPLCDVKNFGAKGDGTTRDTAAIQAAIDHCAGTGGTVRLHDGTFLSGMIRLKSDLRFVVEASAKLKGTQDDSDYPDLNPPTDNTQLSNCRKALVYAQSASNLTIDGEGTIDGSGNKPQWLGPSSLHPERTRPMAIYIALSSQVTIQNIHVIDSAMWSVVNLETDNLVIRNIDIHSNLSGTRDGIDIVDCHHVLIDHCRIFSEDDSICLKSGTARGVEDVTVQNCNVLQSTVANGLKLGTASTGAFKNVIFRNISVQNVDKAAMAVESVDGAQISNIQFRDISFTGAGSAVFVILGKRGNPKHIGSIDNILFENIRGSGMKHTWGSAISGTLLGGITYSPSHLVFRNVQITGLGGLTSIPPDPPEYDGRYPDPNLWGDLPASVFYLRHVAGVQFLETKWDVFPRDARAISVERDVKESSRSSR